MHQRRRSLAIKVEKACFFAFAENDEKLLGLALMDGYDPQNGITQIEGARVDGSARSFLTEGSCGCLDFGLARFVQKQIEGTRLAEMAGGIFSAFRQILKGQ